MPRHRGINTTPASVMAIEFDLLIADLNHSLVLEILITR